MAKHGKLSLAQGTKLISLARKTLKNYLKTGELPKPRSPGEPRGVFVTLHAHPSGKLRGCIGFPFPVDSLEKSVASAAIAAAVNDSRFQPVGEEELSHITLELSVLTIPEEIDYSSPSDLQKKIKVGKDGLIVEYGPYSGLLLPQVALEWKWDSESFLDNLCMKAGLYPEFWKKENPHISKFQAQIFEEKKPGGKVSQKA